MLQPADFYAKALEVYEHALGGLHPVGDMQGISLHEVVCTIHMALNLPHL